MFDSPSGIDIDKDGNLFVADIFNYRIRKITPDGLVSTFAGSGHRSIDDIGVKVGFDAAEGIHIAADGNMYVADGGSNRIRKITPTGTVSTFAGSDIGNSDGIRLVAKYALPKGLCMDPSGNIYVVDRLNYKIRKITPEGVTSTLAGSSDGGYADGKGPAALFSFPEGICIDTNGNLYVTDSGNYKFEKLPLKAW